MGVILEKRYLCFPIRCGAPESRTRFVLPDYDAVISLELDAERPDFHVYFDALAHPGQEIELLHEDDDSLPRAIDLCTLQDEPPCGTPIYLEPNRPLYHFTNARGWINDPNGMVYRDGEYHMFYQLNAFGSRWYDKGWGHAKSRNLFDWEILPPALYADDTGYAISGSALFDEENRAGFGNGAWILAYSTRKGDRAELGQTVDIAWSQDGLIFHKYEGNPVLTDGVQRHFRDPKVFWHAPTQHFAMVLAVGRELRFYHSTDLKAWTQTGVLDNDTIELKDFIYECPEMMEYPVEGGTGTRWVLQVSLMNRVLQIVGDFDGFVFRRDPQTALQWADYGKDFYAAVGYNPSGMGGRHVWIGWMSDWHYAHECPKLEGWMGAFTVPRELTLKRHADGTLAVHQHPARELAELASEPVDMPNRAVIPPQDGYMICEGIACDVRLTLPAGAGTAAIALNYESGETVVLQVDPGKRELTVDRARCALPELGERFTEPLHMPLPGAGEIDLRILTDKGCLEIYALDGRCCMAVLCFPRKHNMEMEIRNASDAPLTIRDLSVRHIRRAHWKI